MSQIGSSTSPAQERQRLERICAVLVEAFEAHPETRDGDPPRGWNTTVLEVRPGGRARAVGKRARAAGGGAHAAMRPTTKLHAVRTVDLPEYESDD
jgi:hypothetical protein